MARATIFAIDDDQPVLDSVERDLRQKYGRDYRILKSNSSSGALEALTQLNGRGDTVALFVVDQRMPGLSGVEFLEKAITVFPDSKRVLLTAYADTDAAINAINKVGLDYYLTKPWDPPEEHLYPTLDGLLDDWRQNIRMPYEGVQVVGARWSAASHEVKDFLARCAVPYRWLDIERDAEAKSLIAGAGAELKIPLLVFTDGQVLVQPSLQEVAAKAGLRTSAERPFYDVVVVGAGPAGLSSAVYASADGLKVLMVEQHAPGGQAGNSPKIENFLGFPSGVSGSDLTRRAVTQARRFGAEILTTRSAAGLRVEGNTKFVKIDDGTEVSSKMVLISTGAWFRTLDLPGVEQWNGAGIYYGAAHTEAANFQGEDVVVVGGANSAAQGTLYLARYAKSVAVLMRGDAPTWSNYLDVAIRARGNIRLMFHTELVNVLRDDERREVVTRNNQTGEEQVVPAEAIFVFIGQKPQSDFLQGVVEMTPSGHILTGLDLVRDGRRPKGWTVDRDPFLLETSVPGVFAAGDVRNGTKHGVAAASGDGNAAVSMFWQYLSTV